MAKQSKNLWGAFGLEFIGSLIYLIVVFTGLGGYAGAVLTQANTAWAWTILFGVAAIGSITLFFTSFANFGGMAKTATASAMKAATISGIALVALTAGNSTYMLVSLLGFVLAFLGAAASSM